MSRWFWYPSNTHTHTHTHTHTPIHVICPEHLDQIQCDRFPPLCCWSAGWSWCPVLHPPKSSPLLEVSHHPDDRPWCAAELAEGASAQGSARLHYQTSEHSRNLWVVSTVSADLYNIVHLLSDKRFWTFISQAIICTCISSKWNLNCKALST